jgi:hypothetical protein
MLLCKDALSIFSRSGEIVFQVLLQLLIFSLFWLPRTVGMEFSYMDVFCLALQALNVPGLLANLSLHPLGR